ncbi:MAG: hypothetical protein SFT68_01030 [Rickettsiaceae bacterium]|nr:hypothetical protein [Rickettsiaceae bacterium]
MSRASHLTPDSDGWIPFDQGQILRAKFPAIFSGGGCYGMCYEFARYLSKDREGREIKDGDGTPEGFIAKLLSKLFSTNEAEAANFVTRVGQYQTSQIFNKRRAYVNQYDNREDSEYREGSSSSNSSTKRKKSNISVDNLVNLTKNNNDVHELSITWKDEGHTICFTKLKTGGYAIFDPNRGMKILQNEQELTRALKEQVEFYKHTAARGKELGLETSNFSDSIRRSGANGSFITTPSGVENNNQNSNYPKTRKYLNRDQALFAELNYKLTESSKVQNYSLDSREFSNLSENILKMKDKHGRTLLDVAKQNGHKEVERVLLGARAYISTATNGYYSPNRGNDRGFFR